MDYRVSDEAGMHMGTVAKFVGERAGTRWWAYSIYRRDPQVEHRKGFRTRREAIAWLLEQKPKDDPKS